MWAKYHYLCSIPSDSFFRNRPTRLPLMLQSNHISPLNCNSHPYLLLESKDHQHRSQKQQGFCSIQCCPLRNSNSGVAEQFIELKAPTHLGNSNVLLTNSTVENGITKCFEQLTGHEEKESQISLVFDGECTSEDIKLVEFNRHIVRKKLDPLSVFKMRELEILLKTSGHPFIISLLEVSKMRGKQGWSYYLLMEGYPHASLRHRVYLQGSIDLEMTKILSYQLFRGLHFIHSFRICHRGINVDNISLSKNRLMIGHFDQAKFLKVGEQNSTNACEGQERAPELILGNRNYNQKVDMWAAGCVMVEMILGRSLFQPTDNPEELIIQIFKLRGFPTVQELNILNPNYRNILKNWKLPTGLRPKSWGEILKQGNLDANLEDLLTKLFRYDFNLRVSALDALAHSYFDSIRNEEEYKRMKLKYELGPEFFIFAPGELPSKYGFLIPNWAMNNDF